MPRVGVFRVGGPAGEGGQQGWQWAMEELTVANRKLCSAELGTFSATSASFSKLAASSSFCKGFWEWLTRG